ncbi:asparagine--tRNA ligase [Mycoplasmopsis hyopharyngis]|uniref:asparagine--tRNA ligase n=1 Tax=Mycoplasmopsis hyopharyngis TaxID=29558 RepID=UPI0038738852
MRKDMHTFKNFLMHPEYFNNWELKVQGWVTSNRGNKKIRFISLNDGSCVQNLQITCKDSNLDFEMLDSISLGTSIEVLGTLKFTPDAKQPIEMIAKEVSILKLADSDYPIQKQEINLETLREIPHLRHRTNLFRTVMLIRSTLSQEIHRYFMDRDFIYVSSPILTGNDGEGAGEMFFVDTDEKEPFFGNKKVSLGVTGQLHAESYAIGFKKVYTFAPTFRAEHSNTKKHANEFWMIEPEVAFAKLQDVIQLSDDLLKNVIRNTIAKHPMEFEYLTSNVDQNLMSKLNTFLNNPLQIIDYKDAIKVLKKNKEKFENQKFEFGLDLATEHERFLAEEYAKGPVAVINFPKDIKAFYMYQNDDGKSVAAFDLLVPGIGELIGGSQRESRYDKLLKRSLEIGIDKDDLQWYLDLRRFGDSGSAGFGIGFERLVMYVTGMDNIRDVIPYPRTNGNIKM